VRTISGIKASRNLDIRQILDIVAFGFQNGAAVSSRGHMAAVAFRQFTVLMAVVIGVNLDGIASSSCCHDGSFQGGALHRRQFPPFSCALTAD
jgi:hypothetical protein